MPQHGIVTIKTVPFQQVKVRVFGADGRELLATDEEVAEADRFQVEVPGIHHSRIRSARFPSFEYANFLSQALVVIVAYIANEGGDDASPLCIPVTMEGEDQDE